jgi:hypothetical protein
MPPRLEFTIKSSIMDRSRRLVLDRAFLEFEDQDRIGQPPIRFLFEDIESMRHGIKAINGYYFRLGRIYCIDIRNYAGQTIKLRLKSIYRIRLQHLEAKYVTILDSLFRYYFNDRVGDYLKLFQEGIAFEMLGIIFTTEGIRLDEKIGVIPWEILGTKSYWSYYAIFSEINPLSYKSFEYIDHWNARILHHVTEEILRIKFPNRKRQISL